LFKEEYMHHLRSVLETFRKQSLYVNEDKCFFGRDHVIFLGFKGNAKGVYVDQEKVVAI